MAAAETGTDAHSVKKVLENGNAHVTTIASSHAATAASPDQNVNGARELRDSYIMTIFNGGPTHARTHERKYTRSRTDARTLTHTRTQTSMPTTREVSTLMSC